MTSAFNHMGILLINPPVDTPWKDVRSQPLGISYIAAYLRENGFRNVGLLDANVRNRLSVGGLVVADGQFPTILHFLDPVSASNINILS